MGRSQRNSRRFLSLTNFLIQVMLNRVRGLTDPAVSAIARSCSRLIELELCDVPLLSPLSVRDVWTYSRYG